MQIISEVPIASLSFEVSHRSILTTFRRVASCRGASLKFDQLRKSPVKIITKSSVVLRFRKSWGLLGRYACVNFPTG